MQERSFEGVWWIPGRERQPTAGRLTFSAGAGAKLAIVGELLTEPEIASGERVPYVFGTIGSPHTGNDVTLVGLSLGSRTMQGDFTRQEFTAGLVLLGIHSETTTATRCEVTYDQLGAWLAGTGFDVEHPHDDTDDQYSVSYRPVPAISADTAQFALTFLTRPHYPVHGHRFVHLTETVAINIVPTIPIDFEELRRQCLWKLQNFFTFATETPTAITSVRAWIPPFVHPAEVLFRHPFVSSEPSDPLKMLFASGQIEPRLTEVFSRWFELYEELGPALDQMFAALYGEYRLADTRFLAVAQALESYHRRRFSIAPEDLAAHERRVARITSACAQEDAEWLAEALQYEYEPPLRARINGLFKRVGRPFLLGMSGPRRKQDSVAHSIATYRNKLAHLTLTSAELDAALIDLHDLTLQMLVILKANLLLDLGFQPADLIASFRYNDGYRLRARRL